MVLKLWVDFDVLYMLSGFNVDVVKCVLIVEMVIVDLIVGGNFVELIKEGVFEIFDKV